MIELIKEKIQEKRERRITSVRDLDVYQIAFRLAMEIFEVSKSFPKEERFALTDQIRRSSRSVCANLAEAWRKRRYKAAFINKLSDAEQEATETQTWLEFAHACGFLDERVFKRLDAEYDHVCAMLVNMERKADAFCNSK